MVFEMFLEFIMSYFLADCAFSFAVNSGLLTRR